jgi:hypothetical protein
MGSLAVSNGMRRFRKNGAATLRCLASAALALAVLLLTFLQVLSDFFDIGVFELLENLERGLGVLEGLGALAKFVQLSSAKNTFGESWKHFSSCRNFLQPIFVMQSTKDGCRYDSAILWNAVPLSLKICLR